LVFPTSVFPSKPCTESLSYSRETVSSYRKIHDKINVGDLRFKGTFLKKTEWPFFAELRPTHSGAGHKLNASLKIGLDRESRPTPVIRKIDFNHPKTDHSE